MRRGAGVIHSCDAVKCVSCIFNPEFIAEMHSVTFPLSLIHVALSRWSINLYFLTYLIPTTFLPPGLLTVFLVKCHWEKSMPQGKLLI